MPSLVQKTYGERDPCTAATSHPVSAFLAFASLKVSVKILFSWERGGLGNALGLRRVKRCLIAGVNLTLAISVVGRRSSGVYFFY